MDLPPSEAVVNFARAAGVMGNISAEVAGMFDVSVAPASEPDPTPRPTPATKTRPRAKKPSGPPRGAVPGASSLAVGKGKSVALADVDSPPFTPGPTPVRGSRFDGVDTGAKRGPPTSPPQVASSSKRTRTAETLRHGRHDLGGIEVNEGTSPVSLVPEAKDVVRNLFLG